jgi:hypothetical protein
VATCVNHVAPSSSEGLQCYRVGGEECNYSGDGVCRIASSSLELINNQLSRVFHSYNSCDCNSCHPAQDDKIVWSSLKKTIVGVPLMIKPDLVKYGFGTRPVPGSSSGLKRTSRG